MEVEAVRSVLLWCIVINYAILLFWWGVFVLAHDWLYRLHTRWFRLSVEQFDSAHYTAMAVFKLGIFLLNLSPYLALLIVA